MSGQSVSAVLGKIRNGYKILVGRLKERDPSEDIDVDVDREKHEI
jgi:hypothetical protein